MGETEWNTALTTCLNDIANCAINIAPTMLALMGIDQPAEMTGHSLVHLLDKKQNAA